MVLLGCDVLDRRLIDLVSDPFAVDSGQPGPLADSGAPMDSGTSMDSGVAEDGSAPFDSGATRDAETDASQGPALDASDDAETDAGQVCGVAGFDCCPEDTSKLAPGECGCGIADDDGDGDQTPDCFDLCPSDPNNTEPGACGCGADEAAATECSALEAALIHRYRFEGTGTVAVDDVGDADGTVMNATLDGSATLTLAGGTSNQYVDLPDGMISVLTDATFEVWLSWQGGGGWQRVFDFGDTTSNVGRSYVFITPQRAGGTAALRATIV